MNRRTLLGSLVSVAAFSMPAHKAVAQATPKQHRVAFQVDGDEADLMNEILNNITNMYSYYESRGETVSVELVAFGHGLTMLREDTSPVKSRLTALHAKYPSLVFSACANSIHAASREEGKDISIVPEAGIVPSGVVRLSELQEQGWTYLRP